MGAYYSRTLAPGSACVVHGPKRAPQPLHPKNGMQEAKPAGARQGGARPAQTFRLLLTLHFLCICSQGWGGGGRKSFCGSTDTGKGPTGIISVAQMRTPSLGGQDRAGRARAIAHCTRHLAASRDTAGTSSHLRPWHAATPGGKPSGCASTATPQCRAARDGGGCGWSNG